MELKNGFRGVELGGESPLLIDTKSKSHGHRIKTIWTLRIAPRGKF